MNNLRVYIEQPNDGFCGEKQKVRIYCDDNEHVATVMRNDDLPLAKKRAVQITKAVNAYPRLVDALRNALRSDQYKVIAEMEASALLRELGEM